MSEEGKKNGEYEKPESHRIDPDDLDDVSGGAEGDPGGKGSISIAHPWCSSGVSAAVEQHKDNPTL